MRRGARADPDAYRHGTPILIRADTAGATKEFLAQLRALHQQAVSSSFSVGWAITERERAAISALPNTVWADAIDADGAHREGAALAEITGMLPARVLAGYPIGTRVIARRERPHPGAQLDAFEERDGYRYTALATDTAFGHLAHLDGRHRAHARVDDRIRTAKDTGLDHFPSRTFTINATWLTVVMLAVDLIAWTQLLLLHGIGGQGRQRAARGRRYRSHKRPGTDRPGTAGRCPWVTSAPGRPAGVVVERASQFMGGRAGGFGSIDDRLRDTPVESAHRYAEQCGDLK